MSAVGVPLRSRRPARSRASPEICSAHLNSGGPTIWLSTITEMMVEAKASPQAGNSTATSLARPRPIPAWVMNDIQPMRLSRMGSPAATPPAKEPRTTSSKMELLPVAIRHSVMITTLVALKWSIAFYSRADAR